MPAEARFRASDRRGDQFAVERVRPGWTEFYDYARAIPKIVDSAWTAKFVPDYLSPEDLKAKMLSPQEQKARLWLPVNNAKYYLATRSAYNEDVAESSPVMQDEDRRKLAVEAVIRIETYTPRRPWKASYPNVTDLEVVGGKLDGIYEKEAAALLFVALLGYNSESRLSAYSEEPNTDGVEWYRNVGFESVGKVVPEKIGASVLNYVHMEAPSVGLVTEQLAGQYPWLVTGR